MKTKIIVIVCLLAFNQSVFAAQSMPTYGLNEDTKECAEFFMGDECTICELPEKWEKVDGFNCPVDYFEIEMNSVCIPRKDSFCCTVQHSGSNGNCADVVLNEIEKKCAFVEDITKCASLPKNWKQPEDSEIWGTLCPSITYEWLEDELECKENLIINHIGKEEIDIKGEEDDSKTSFFAFWEILMSLLMMFF